MTITIEMRRRQPGRGRKENSRGERERQIQTNEGRQTDLLSVEIVDADYSLLSSGVLPSQAS